MTGHVLRVELDVDTVRLRVECHENQSALCRQQCVNPDHEDYCSCLPSELALSDECGHVVWLDEDRSLIPELYGGGDCIPIHDGMPIKVRWNSSDQSHEWVVA